MIEKRPNIEDNIGTSGLIKDMAKYLPSTIISAIIGIVFLPIITRLFSPNDYGNYVLVMVTVYILTIIVGWVSFSVVRFYPAYEKKVSHRFAGQPSGSARNC